VEPEDLFRESFCSLHQSSIGTVSDFGQYFDVKSLPHELSPSILALLGTFPLNMACRLFPRWNRWTG